MPANRIVRDSESGGIMDPIAERRISWVEKVRDWSQGELKPIAIPPDRKHPQLTDTLQEFDGLLVEACFEPEERAYSVSIIPTANGHQTRYGVDALISPEDGIYRYVGWVISDGGDPDAQGEVIEMDAIGEFCDGKWKQFSNSGKGQQVAEKNFDNYLALITKQLDTQAGLSK